VEDSRISKVEKGKGETVYLVTDTSWWIEEGYSDLPSRFLQNTTGIKLIVPHGVFYELDGLKKNTEKGKKAVAATKKIFFLTTKGKAELYSKNGKNKLNKVLSSRVDEEVVNTAEKLKNNGNVVFILSTDYAQRTLAESKGIYTARTLKVLDFIIKAPEIWIIDTSWWIDVVKNFSVNGVANALEDSPIEGVYLPNY
jgi:rRNA-processing protein FCF1